MCWRLWCVVEKNAPISDEIKRAYSIKTVQDRSIEQYGDLICYEIGNGMCACGIIQPEVVANDDEKWIKKWQKQGVSNTAISRRLAEKARLSRHKKTQQKTQLLDKWLTIQPQAYLLLQWQKNNCRDIPFIKCEKVISAIYQLPENNWVKYQAEN